MYTNKNFSIVIIDDDPAFSEMLKDFIKNKFPNAELAAYDTGESAMSGIYKSPDVIVLDYHLDSSKSEAMNGIQVLKKLKEQYSDTLVIFMSGNDRAEIAANTIKYGAYDFIVKNESAFHRLEIILNNILSHGELKKNLGSQKFFNGLLLVLLIVVIIGIIYLKIN